MNDYDEESIAAGTESKYCMALIKRFKIEQAKQLQYQDALAELENGE